MNPTIFRAYSIRGIAHQTLTVNDMALIGQATATLLHELSDIREAWKSEWGME